MTEKERVAIMNNILFLFTVVEQQQEEMKRETAHINNSCATLADKLR